MVLLAKSYDFGAALVGQLSGYAYRACFALVCICMRIGWDHVECRPVYVLSVYPHLQ